MFFFSPFYLFSSFSLPQPQPHYGVFDVQPWPMSHLPTDTHTHRFWWSLWGPSESAVFIVGRMYRVISLNHWLPLFQLGACTVNCWYVNVSADCVLKGVSGLDSRLQYTPSPCISLTPKMSIYIICVCPSWLFWTFPLWLTYLEQLPQQCSSSIRDLFLVCLLAHCVSQS